MSGDFSVDNTYLLLNDVAEALMKALVVETSYNEPSFVFTM